MKTKLVKPVLIPSKSHTDFLFDVWNKRLLQASDYKKQTLSLTLSIRDGKFHYVYIGLVSVDPNEKIGSGDFVFDYFNGKVYRNNGITREGIRKIIATQSELSTELIQQICDESNMIDGEMKEFEIEMDCVPGGFNTPKLTNGYVTVVSQVTKVEEPILYTEEEVINLLNKLGYDLAGNGMLLDYEFKVKQVWFDNNLKKK
jgi:hypothetical protein